MHSFVSNDEIILQNKQIHKHAHSMKVKVRKRMRLSFCEKLEKKTVTGLVNGNEHTSLVNSRNETNQRYHIHMKVIQIAGDSETKKKRN